MFRFVVCFVDFIGFTLILRNMNAKEFSDFLSNFEGRTYDTATDEVPRMVGLERRVERCRRQTAALSARCWGLLVVDLVEAVAVGIASAR